MRLKNEKSAVRAHVATVLVVALTLCAQHAFALGVVETPAAGRVESGIGLVSGWHCSGSRIEIRIDSGPAQRAASGTSRDDTLSACGRADTGYGLLLNFNLLDAGAHTLVAYADGVEFATTSFTTVRYDQPYVTGVAGTFPLHHFPTFDTTTIVQWQEEKQNFSIVAALGAPRVRGTYYGAFRRSLDCGDMSQVQHGTFEVSLVDSILTVTASYGGRSCVLAAEASAVDGAARTVPGAKKVSTCPEFSDFQVVVDGLRITVGEIGDGCASRSLVGAK